jgi:hypothetical protein
MQQYAAPMCVWICQDDAPHCGPTTMCDGCLGRELTAKRGQARVAGAVWAEEIAARHPDLRRHLAWPATDVSRAIARRRVLALATDQLLGNALAESCLAGAAAWWAGRPERYR